MANLISDNGVCAYGGAVVKLSSGTLVAVFTVGNGNLVAYKNIDGTPSQLGGNQSATAMFGSGTIYSCHAALDSNDDLHVVAVSSSVDATRAVAYNKLSSIDGTPSWGTWEGIATYGEGPGSTAYGSLVVIRIDSNDYPRVAWTELYKYKGVNRAQPYYSHNVGSGWITKERIPTSDIHAAVYGVGMELTSDDDVEVEWIDDTDYTLYHRRRNSSWGTQNEWTSINPVYLSRHGIARSSGDTVYRYAVLSGYVYENDASTGLSQVYGNSGYRQTCVAMYGTHRWVAFVSSDGYDIYAAYNSGSGWTEQLLEEHSYLMTSGLICSSGFRNNGFADGSIGIIYADSQSDIYYTSYSTGPTIHYASATLTGTGDLDATTLNMVYAVAPLSGAGDLDATTLNIINGAAAPSGAGDLSAILERIVNLAASLSGAGDLSATGEAIVAAVAHLTGAGDLSAATLQLVLAAAELAAAGDLSAATLNIVYAAATLAGAGDLTAAGGILLLGSATLSGTGDLSATLERIVNGQASISGAGDLAAVPDLLVLADAVLSGEGDLSAILERIVSDSAALTGAGDLSAAAYLIKYAAATLTGQGDLSATGEIGGIVTAEAHLTGAGDLSAAAYLIINALSTLSGTGDLSGVPTLFVLASATLTGQGDLSAVCEVVPGGGIVWGEAHLTGAGDLSADTLLLISSDATLLGVGDLSATGVRVLSTSASLVGAGQLSAVPNLIVTNAAVLSGAGDLSATVLVLVLAAAGLSGFGDVYVAPVVLKYAQAVLSGVGDLSANGYIEGWEPVRRVYRPVLRGLYRAAGMRVYIVGGSRTTSKKGD